MAEHHPQSKPLLLSLPEPLRWVSAWTVWSLGLILLPYIHLNPHAEPEVGRSCWSSAQKRWVKVTEPSKTWVCKSGLWCCCLTHRWMHYWGGNIFIIPASFMVTVCGKGKRNTGCERNSVHGGHFCSCFMQSVFFLFRDLNIDLMESVCVKTRQKPRQR